ncbi:hypothetical protein Tco_0542340 [Tanacetum coccineum]
MLWGESHSILMLIMLELLWEEFTHGIQTFFSHEGIVTKPSLKNPMKKVNSSLIHYGRFSKVIILLGNAITNHRRPDSAIHYTGDDFILGNLKFVPKDDEACQQESIPQEEGDDPDIELAKKMSLEAHQEKGEREGDDADMERAIKLSLDLAFLPQGQDLIGGVNKSGDPLKKRTTDQVYPCYCVIKTLMFDNWDPLLKPEDDHIRERIHESFIKSDSERTENETDAAGGGWLLLKLEARAGPDPEPMKEDKTGSDSGNLMCLLLEQNPSTWMMEFLATSPTQRQKSKFRRELIPSLPDPSQTVTSTPPVIAPFTDVSSTKPSSLVTTPPINTEATTITTSLPEITPFIALSS